MQPSLKYQWSGIHLSLDPEDFDPLGRRDPRSRHPKDPRQSINHDIVALIQQLQVRIEKLEEDMRLVKKKLKI